MKVILSRYLSLKYAFRFEFLCLCLAFLDIMRSLFGLLMTCLFFNRDPNYLGPSSFLAVTYQSNIASKIKLYKLNLPTISVYIRQTDKHCFTMWCKLSIYVFDILLSAMCYYESLRRHHYTTSTSVDLKQNPIRHKIQQSIFNCKFWLMFPQ